MIVAVIKITITFILPKNAQIQKKKKSSKKDIQTANINTDKCVSFRDFLYLCRSGDVQSESKQFQELLLERTKALAAQAEALKSNSDGKYGSKKM